MKDETGGVVFMYSFLVDNSEHKKAKGVNKMNLMNIKMY